MVDEDQQILYLLMEISGKTEQVENTLIFFLFIYFFI